MFVRLAAGGLGFALTGGWTVRTAWAVLTRPESRRWVLATRHRTT